jgi:16S rRNA G966 N2-methylase RsmD
MENDPAKNFIGFKSTAKLGVIEKSRAEKMNKKMNRKLKLALVYIDKPFSGKAADAKSYIEAAVDVYHEEAKAIIESEFGELKWTDNC